jgi:cbb3-type cytochrome oxidase maturation protein
MDSLFLLIPLSVTLVLVIGAVLAWAALSGQFEDLEAEGQRILQEGDPPDSSNTTPEGRAH